MARALELAHQLRVVVDLTVLDDRARAVLVGDRLVPRGKVDDREPSRREPDPAVDERAVRVRSAVDERGRHREQSVAVDGPARGDDPADPAHAREL